MLTRRKPKLFKMQTFGTAYSFYKQNKRKLYSRCAKGMLAGNDKNISAFWVFCPNSGKVLSHRLVMSVMKTTVGRQTQTDMMPCDKDDFEI